MKLMTAILVVGVLAGSVWAQNALCFSWFRSRPDRVRGGARTGGGGKTFASGKTVAQSIETKAGGNVAWGRHDGGRRWSG